MFDLCGRVAMVTGGSRGLGRSIVLDLCRDCAVVAFTYEKNEAAASAVVQEAGAAGRHVISFRATVQDRDEMAAVFAAIEQSHGVVDLLVNNAGVNISSPISTMTMAAWQHSLAVNLTGSFICAQLAARNMQRRGSGSIVNISSISGLRGQPGEASYSATKAGLIGLTKSLAWELAPFGITVNAVAPGWIDTGMADAMPLKRKQRAIGQVAMGRFGAVGEVAGAVRYLASAAGKYTTGQVMVMDGGIP